MYPVVNLAYGLGQAAPVPVQAPSQAPTPAPAAAPAPAGSPPATYGCPTPAQMQAVQKATGYAPPGGQGAFVEGVDPTLNCMRDARGNAICSDGLHYPPGCRHTPPEQYFTPGVTPDVTTNGRIEGQIPAPRAGGGGAVQAPAAAGGSPAAPSSWTSPVVMVGAGALGAGLLATGAYFLFLK